jgi:hypothetical protein
MPNGTETSGTAASLEDIFPDLPPADDDDRGDEIPHGPRDFPGYPSFIARLANWLFGEDYE